MMNIVDGGVVYETATSKGTMTFHESETGRVWKWQGTTTDGRAVRTELTRSSFRRVRQLVVPGGSELTSIGRPLAAVQRMAATVGRDHVGHSRVLLQEQATAERFSGYAVEMWRSRHWTSASAIKSAPSITIGLLVVTQKQSLDEL
jgi:hypothetical protein